MTLTFIYMAGYCSRGNGKLLSCGLLTVMGYFFGGTVLVVCLLVLTVTNTEARRGKRKGIKKTGGGIKPDFPYSLALRVIVTSQKLANVRRTDTVD